MSLKISFNQFFAPVKEGFANAFKDARAVLDLKAHFRYVSKFIKRYIDRSKKNKLKL